MKKLFSILALGLLYATMLFGQAAVDIPITVSDNAGNSKVLNFGLDETATTGIDPALGESDLPPFPVSGIFEGRFDLSPFGVGNLSTYQDYRNAPAFPYTGTVEHRLIWQLGSGGSTFTVNYDLPAEATIEITDALGFPTPVFDSGILSGTGSYTITAAVTSAKLFVTYSGIGPVDPGPVFSVSPSSLDFGNVGLGGSSTETLTVSNLGSTNPMTISSATIANTDYSIVPNPAITYPIVIAAGGSYDFDVTFTPAGAGVSSGNVEFDHDAPGSPSLVPVTGNGQAQGGDLVFDPQTRTIFDNTQGYPTAIRLENYVGDDLKALQFKIVLDGGLLFRSITRGADVPAPDWNFSYTIAEGAFNADGSRNDTVKVVLVGNGTAQLAPGDYEIANIEYDAADIAENSTTTTVHFEGVNGGTGTPNPGGDAAVTAGPAQDITIENRVFYGDVNIDNRVDILDLLLMVDKILDKTTFTAEQFTRGDIAPWPAGDPAPSPDGVINAQDLALLQNIILTGQYPSGESAEKAIQSPVIAENGVGKINPGDDAALTFYITNSGIAVELETLIDVKGLQVNFSNVENSTSGMNIESQMSNNPYYQDSNILRVLVYNNEGEVLTPGKYLYLDMPFAITNPRDIKIDNVILADENNEQINKMSVEVVYNDAPQLPTKYSLSQNYPNPFNPTTEVQFTVPEKSNVDIIVYNMLGQKVRTLYEGQAQQGTYRVSWDGRNEAGQKMSSGSYIYRMIAGDFVQSKKMILLK